jgi:hypothetical protein
MLELRVRTFGSLAEQNIGVSDGHLTITRSNLTDSAIREDEAPSELAWRRVESLCCPWERLGRDFDGAMLCE